MSPFKIMLINRDIVLEKLNAYLGNAISKEDLYEWALLVSLLEDNQGIINADPLLRASLKAMMESKHKDSAKFAVIKTIEYYRQCLSGEVEFSPASVQHLSPDMKTPVSAGEAAAPVTQKILTLPELVQVFKGWKYFKDTFLTARLYVLVFAVCSFAVQISSVINPGFMQIGLLVPTHWQAFVDALPHLVYAYLVMLPPRRLIPRKIFLIALPVFIVGAVFYWKMSFFILAKLSLNGIFILAILPFSAIPATVALALLLAEKFEFAKVKSPFQSIIK